MKREKKPGRKGRNTIRYSHVRVLWKQGLSGASPGGVGTLSRDGSLRNSEEGKTEQGVDHCARGTS